MPKKGGELPHFNVHCPICGWKSNRTYDEGFGHCKKCKTLMVKTKPTSRHIVTK